MEAVIIYNNKDITRDISGRLERIVYEDWLEHRASSIALHLENDNLDFWAGWKPASEDTIEVSLVDDAGRSLKCGTFWMDTIRSQKNRNKSTIQICGMSGKPSLFHYPQAVGQLQKKPIREVVSKIAGQVGYIVGGDLGSEIISYNVEAGEKPMRSLYNIARRWGYVMKLEGGTVFFYAYDSLAKSEVAKINISDVVDVSIEEGSVGQYKSCEVRHYDSAKKMTIIGKASSSLSTGTEAVLWEEVKDQSEAVKRAENWLKEKNKKNVEIGISMRGDTRIVSGVRVGLEGFKQYDDKAYIVSRATHTMERNRYMMDITLNKK